MKRLEAPENAAKLLVDTRGVIYASYFWAKKHYDVENREEFESAMLARFFDKLRSAHYYANTNRIIFCCDSATSKRRELYPDYKGRRPKDEHFLLYKDFFLKIQNEILPAMGFNNVIEAEGLEADDIIASICLKENKLPIVIFSDDADLYQCLKPNVTMLSVVRSGNSVMDVVKFEKHFNIPASRWADVKAICGCTTDNVPGVPQCGEGRAIAYLNGELKGGVVRTRIEQSAGIIKFTDRLVRLPFDGVVLSIDWLVDTFNKDYILDMIEKYTLLFMNEPFWGKFFGFTK